MRQIFAFPSHARACAVLSLVLATAGAAANASVVWQLNNFSFTDGATATGQFTWDEATNVATSWNIATTAGTLGANTYMDINSSMYTSASANSITFYVGSRQLRLAFLNVDNLDTPTSHLTLFSQNFGQTGQNGYLECNNCSPYRVGQAGAYLSSAVPTSAIPEPSTAALSVLTLGLLAAVRRRKV